MMAESGTTCGNCGARVAAADVLCPACGGLLAAYASPAGAVTTAAVVTPPAEAMEAPPPTIRVDTEAEPISTAPRPLFDTYVTVEELAHAAEGDHTDDVVTISEPVPTAVATFDIPHYAVPPADAAPLPVIAELEPTGHREQPTTAPATEQWLQGALSADQPVKASSLKKATAAVGHTEAYLRRLDAMSGYTARVGNRSKPVAADRLPPEQRGRQENQPVGMVRPGYTSTVNGIFNWVLWFVVVLLWIGVVVSLLTGDVNITVIVIAVALTMLARRGFRAAPITRRPR